jgi:hypothetical protein
LYEHSNYDENHTDVYEVGRDISHSLVTRFGLKSLFPKYKYTDQFPIAWVSPSRFLAVVQNNEFKVDTPIYVPVDEGSPWLVLFDAVTGKIVWKTQIKDNFSPSEFQQPSPTSALAQIDKKVYEISLPDGKLIERPIFKFTAFAASPDKKTMAFFDFRKLFVSAIDGENRKVIFDLPDDWKHDLDHKGLGVRPPLWSPDGETIIIFGEKQLYFVRQ